jgi:hypothetical protein
MTDPQSRSKLYRKRAALVHQLAGKARNLDEKNVYLAIERNWLELAERVERAERDEDA